LIKSFTDLRRNSQTDFAELNEKIKQLNQPFQRDDDRFWQPTVDKAGNGYAIIRFLPHDPDEEDLPFVRIYDHGFKGPGGWYIEKSLTSIGKPDPVSEYNSALWASGEKGQEFVRGKPGDRDRPGSKRRLHYISNIYIIKDDLVPENNGTTRLYKYGARIFEKLDFLMNPKFPDQKPLNPFHVWEGANFILRACNVDNQRNYNQSEFAHAGPFADDATMERAWTSRVHPLKQFLDPSQFKSYDELKKRLDKVLNPIASVASSKSLEDLPAVPSPSLAPRIEPIEDTPPWATDDSDDDLAAFKRLAAQ
jgi:hypothetical protein